MPERKTVERARRKSGKAKRRVPRPQAGEFVREEIEHVRKGKHGARSTKQAIAIGLSKARKAGIDVPPKEKSAKKKSKSAAGGKKKAVSSKRGGKKKSSKRSQATTRALQRESRQAASHQALSRQAKQTAHKRKSSGKKRAGKKVGKKKISGNRREKDARGRGAAPSRMHRRVGHRRRHASVRSLMLNLRPCLPSSPFPG